ncbi:MAG: type I-C CRISPR-associated endonuclease Cas1c [bacterium]
MKKLLNTLYLTTQDSWIKKDGANIVVSKDGNEIGRAPLHMLGSIVCFGRIGHSTSILNECANLGISMTFLTEYGRFQARLVGPQSGNVLLRRAQHRTTMDLKLAAPIARSIVAAKISNQRKAVARAIRDYQGDYKPQDVSKLKSICRSLKLAARKCLSTEIMDQIRGIEGDAAATFFSCFNHLVRRKEPELNFTGRNRRPPRDAINAVLSFLYVIVMHDCRAGLESVGLDGQMGFLHRDRPGRSSLALDLLEEFRTPIAERTCLNLFNRKQLNPSDFIHEPNGAVILKDKARKTVLVALQERKRTEIVHPFLEEKVPLGLIPLIQAQLLARHLRGDIDGYPAFFWR